MRAALALTLFISITRLTTCEETTWNLVTMMSRGSEEMRNYIDNQSLRMKSIFETEKLKLENKLNTVTESVKNYWREKEKKFSNDFNNLKEHVQESGKSFMDSWSYLPNEEEGAKLEDPEAVLSVPAIITGTGYPCETHIVQSEGYYLHIHRIPHGKVSEKVTAKTVILQHGLFASSADWILNGPDKSLGYVLADAGYDVWMTNIRGNKYSREHAWLKTDSKSYWNFSWHDVAKHDVPAIINYIISSKGNASISYIGHSMGTTILFTMLSIRPEYNDILTSAIALAPEVFTSNMKSPLKSLAPLANNIAKMEMTFKSYEFVPKNSVLGKLSTSCDSGATDSIACKMAVFYLCGYDEGQFDKERLNVFLAHLGTGTSWKTILHFAQGINSGRFQQYDYGFNNNMKVYGTPSPPEYDLSKIILPITIFWSKNDLLSSEKDVQKLYDSLPKENTELYLVPYPDFNHVDYVLARDAPKLVNEKVLEKLGDDNSAIFVSV